MSPGILAIMIAIYFLPTPVSCIRAKVEGTFGVVLVNLFLGRTVLGWLGAFLCACSGRTEGDIRWEKRRHAELLTTLKRQYADLVACDLP